MNPEQAKHVKEVEEKISEWKVNLRYLSETVDNSIDDDLKKTTLSRILSETIAEHVTQKYDEENSYDDMEPFCLR